MMGAQADFYAIIFLAYQDRHIKIFLNVFRIIGSLFS